MKTTPPNGIENVPQQRQYSPPTRTNYLERDKNRSKIYENTDLGADPIRLDSFNIIRM